MASTTMKGVSEGKIIEHCLQGNVYKFQVLVFYESDWDPSSLSLLTQFSLLKDKFLAQNCSLYGCTKDTEAPHLQRIKVELGTRLKFPLLSDPEGLLADKFSLFDHKERLCLRGVVVVDHNGEQLATVVSGLGEEDLARLIFNVVEQASKPNQRCQTKTGNFTGGISLQNQFQGMKKPHNQIGSQRPGLDSAEIPRKGWNYFQVWDAFDQVPSQVPRKSWSYFQVWDAVDQFPPKIVNNQSGVVEVRKKNKELALKQKAGKETWGPVSPKSPSSGPVSLKSPSWGPVSPKSPSSSPVGPNGPAWGPVGPKCPVCEKTVYALEQVFAVDRKPFHKNCINCQAQGCRNQLYSRGMHRVRGWVICDMCYKESIPRDFGPATRRETEEEMRMREAKEQMEKKQREMAMHELKDVMKTPGKTYKPSSGMKIAEVLRMNLNKNIGSF